MHASAPFDDMYLLGIQQAQLISAVSRIVGSVDECASILDVGCGSGVFTEKLLGRKGVFGVDVREEACARANARGMIAVCGSALALPFPDEKFDLIYSVEMLQAITDVPRLRGELTRVCRGGGRSVSSTLNGASLARWLLRRLRPQTSILRLPKTVIADVSGLPLVVRSTSWLHTPMPWVHRSRRATQYSLDMFASNFILEFTKTV